MTAVLAQCAILMIRQPAPHHVIRQADSYVNYIDIHWYKLTPQHLQSKVTHWVELPCSSQQFLTGVAEHAEE